MNNKLRIGLLPCYLKLYDDATPQTRAGFELLLEQARALFTSRGMEVEMTPVCRVAAEFEQAVAQVEKASADCLVTLHLAYSPSLEAIDACCRTELPLLLLDTTMDGAFGRDTPSSRVMFNHGVHGVMDLASLLNRRRRPFEIVAGHIGDPRTGERAAAVVQAAAGAHRFQHTRAARFGKAFAGMGDFDVAEDILAARLGIQVRNMAVQEVAAAAAQIGDREVADELAADRELYVCDIAPESHARSLRVGLALRKLLQREGCDAFSANFQCFGQEAGAAATMPFLEICKAMGRGIGYAGEGDVLTAALVGALARAFGAVTFTEVFCPDWQGNALFLSHMGEISPSVAASRPRIIEKRPFLFGPHPPAVMSMPVKAGAAVFVNLAPGPDDTFKLIVAPVEVLPDDDHGPMRDLVRAWIRPGGEIGAFLEAYSRHGGTHHSALVLGNRVAEVSAFGRMCGMDVVCIPAGAEG
jgi:L-arabinose isomerase